MIAVLFVTGDLMFVSRAAGAAERAGVTLETATQSDMAAARCGERAFDLVLLDLSLAAIDPAELVPRLRSAAQPPGAIIAYGPHVHQAQLEAARAALCDRVLTRGQFSSQLESLLVSLRK